MCQVTCADPDYVANVGPIGCLANATDTIEERRPYECFHACGVDACLEWLQDWNESCEYDEDELIPCIDPETVPFYMNGEFGLECTVDDGMGW